ncbi:MAG: anaerobic glycerol-3-phosphate dehydrogenase subunit GlpA [Moorellaceae bacterium]
MIVETTQVVVIGGGATGTGILRDLALRGIPAVLLEQGDLAHGTSGRFHGLLHSGGRYAVRDLSAAEECIRENRILKEIAGCCIDDCGGFFVQLEGEPNDYPDQWVKACEKAGIPVEEIPVKMARELEPNLSRDVKRVFKVPDAHIDGFFLTLFNAESAVELGAKVETYAKAIGFIMNNDKIEGVRVKDQLTGEERTIKCEMVINAAGPWAGMVASMAGVQLEIFYDRGALVIFHHRLNDRVINRCRLPADGDILVPAGPVSILGTTSVKVDTPEDLSVDLEEVRYLVSLGSEVLPLLSQARVMRVFAGVRPLYSSGQAGSAGREVSRNFEVIDHEERDGVRGFISIVGGKLTTYRLMAEVTTNLACRKLNLTTPCSTDKIPLRAPVEGEMFQEALRLLSLPVVSKAYKRLGPNIKTLLEKVKRDPAQAEIICECELVTRAEIEMLLEGNLPGVVPIRTLRDLLRRTRLGMGPCQGTYCGYRAMLLGYAYGKWSSKAAKEELREFLRHRWKGQQFITAGSQVKQLAMSRKLYETSFNFSLTP